MAANIRNTNLRFNLEKDLQRKAWEYLQTMDKQEFRSYSQVIALALVEYFDRYYRTLKAVEKSLEQYLPLFLSGLTAGLAPREPQNKASLPLSKEPESDAEVDWEFLGE